MQSCVLRDRVHLNLKLTLVLEMWHLGLGLDERLPSDLETCFQDKETCPPRERTTPLIFLSPKGQCQLPDYFP